MKRFYIYIITSHKKEILHVGLCRDLIKTLKFYDQLPSLFFKPDEVLNSLVYFEEAESEAPAMDRFKEIVSLPREKKVKVIEYANQEWASITEDMLKRHNENPKFI